MVVVGATPAQESVKKPQQSTGQKKKDFPALPEGVYPAEVVVAKYCGRAEEQNWPSWKDYDHEVSWRFRITSGEYKNRQFFYDTELTLESGSKLRRVIQELLLMDELPDDYQLDTDDLTDWEGLDCRIRLNRYESKKYHEYRNGVQEVLRPTDAMYEENPF